MKRNPFSLLLLTGIIILTTVTYAQESKLPVFITDSLENYITRGMIK